MTTLPTTAPPVSSDRSLASPTGTLLRLLAVALIDAFAIWFGYQLVRDGSWVLLAFIVVITIGINIFYLRPEFYPYRWFAPGLALMVLMIAYPTMYTIYIAFTNNSDGHLLTQEQALRVLQSQVYLPEDATSYDFVAFRAEDEATQPTYVVYLTDPDGNQFIARPGEPLEPTTEPVPDTLAGYEKLNAIRVASDDALKQQTFGVAPDLIGISGRKLGRFEQRYIYDPVTEKMTDQSTGIEYTPVRGTFTAPDGSTLIPGYYVTIGIENFTRFFTSPALRGPLVTIFTWTILQALGTVFITFVTGLGVALLLNSDLIPAKKVLRSFILIPYAIPAFISVLIWRGLLSEQLGLVNTTLDSAFGVTIPWFSNYHWSRIAIFLIQMWLGFPYMALIITGALQAIPSEIYEAAEVDGATAVQRFWRLTLPLLLVAVGPLLIASFAFNFNNFAVLRLFNEGGPPIPNTPTPAGYTDILITYSYRLAFAGGRGADFGYAAAITMVIFVIVAIITLFNFRFTRIWEEVSENV